MAPPSPWSQVQVQDTGGWCPCPCCTQGELPVKRFVTGHYAGSGAERWSGLHGAQLKIPRYEEKGGYEIIKCIQTSSLENTIVSNEQLNTIHLLYKMVNVVKIELKMHAIGAPQFPVVQWCATPGLVISC